MRGMDNLKRFNGYDMEEWDASHEEELPGGGYVEWEDAQKLIAELERLAGPVCPHEGKRAIEHTENLCLFGDNAHPTWPDGAQWHWNSKTS